MTTSSPSLSEIVAAAERGVRDAQKLDSITMLSQEDLRKAFGIGADLLREVRESQGFPRPVKIGKTIRWRKAAVIAWLEKQEGRSRG